MSKKSFRDNPALQFMSRVEKEETKEVMVTEPKEIHEITQDARIIASNFHIVPTVFEAKSKRFNMLIKPSVFENLKKISENNGTSVNDLINKIVEEYISSDTK